MTALTPEQKREFRTQALRNQASDIRADATEAEQDWLEVADSLDAAADEVDRLRAAIDHMVPGHTVPQFARVLQDRERLRAVLENAPHSRECNYSGPTWAIPCTCWKADAL